MAAFAAFLKKAVAFGSVALPVLVALEAVPGTPGKVAAMLAAGVGALVHRAKAPL